MDNIVSVLCEVRPDGTRIGGFIAWDVVAIENRGQAGDVHGQDVEGAARVRHHAAEPCKECKGVSVLHPGCALVKVAETKVPRCFFFLFFSLRGLAILSCRVGPGVTTAFGFAVIGSAVLPILALYPRERGRRLGG